MNKDIFNMGGCSSFAEVFHERFKNKIPSLKLAVVRGRVKMDDYEEYGDTEWEDCHAVVMLNDEYYFDVDGLVKFNPKSEDFEFSNDTLKVELIALDDKDYKKDDYSIYREFDKLEKNIHVSFGLVEIDGELDFEEIDDYKEEANKYIDENNLFFNSEIEKGINVITNTQSPLNNLIKNYENSINENKKEIIIVKPTKNNDPENFVEDLKNILPTYLNIDIKEDFSADLVYLKFSSSQELPDFSYGNTPKEVINQYLIDNDFHTVDSDLSKTQDAFKNIKSKFIDEILKDTPYLDTKVMFYSNPMSEWSKRDINLAIKQAKSVKSDFETIDEFLLIDDSYSNRDKTQVYYHNIDCEKDANNIRGLSHLIEYLEDRYKEGKIQFDKISSELNENEIKVHEVSQQEHNENEDKIVNKNIKRSR